MPVENRDAARAPRPRDRVVPPRQTFLQRPLTPPCVPGPASVRSTHARHVRNDCEPCRIRRDSSRALLVATQATSNAASLLLSARRRPRRTNDPPSRDRPFSSGDKRAARSCPTCVLPRLLLRTLLARSGNDPAENRDHLLKLYRQYSVVNHDRAEDPVRRHRGDEV